MISRRTFLAGTVSAAALALGRPVSAESKLNDDGLYHEPWFLESLLELADDLDGANTQGKRFAIMWELRGCPYCRDTHLINFAKPEIAGFVKAGYRAVKLKTGAAAPADEAKRVRIVREAIGKDVSLMLDMNAPYDVDGCIEFARHVEPLDIFWLEEPLHWYLQPADYVRVAAATSIPLAHGERE